MSHDSFKPRTQIAGQQTLSAAGVTMPVPADFAPTAQDIMQDAIARECDEMKAFLLAKNRAYGNSASEPVGIFARRFDVLAQIDVRIDDKLNRLKKGSEYPGDDTVKDLIGYLILRRAVESTTRKDRSLEWLARVKADTDKDHA